jgi:hypothetical protein
MAASALRFAHASNLRIDVPLRGVGELSNATRRLVEDAPAAAWERIVEACIDREVAFLLLTPRTSAESLAPFDSRVLLNGFRQLGEFEIPVYWSLAPGESLGAPSHDELPDNVTLLTERGSTATLIREGCAAASISRGTSTRSMYSGNRLQAAATSAPPLQIRIADEANEIDAALTSGDREGGLHDYVACWGGTREQTQNVGRELWADPGTPLGRTSEESAGGGINLIEWDGGRITEVLRVPTATVHWQRCVLGLQPETTHDELIERLQFALLEREAAIGERLWLIEWQMVGAGPEFEKLQADVVQREVEAAVESVLGNSDRLQRVHRWELRRAGMNSTDAVSQRLLEWLAVHAESECESIVREVADPSTGLRPSIVREDAERLLADWLTPAENRE